MNTKKAAAVAIVAALGVTTLAACGGGDGGKDKATGTPAPKTVTLVSHDSFNASKEVLAEFTRQTGFTVKVLKSGDAGEAVNKEILTKGSPRATSSSASTTPCSPAPSTTASSRRTRRRA